MDSRIICLQAGLILYEISEKDRTVIKNIVSGIEAVTMKSCINAFRAFVIKKTDGFHDYQKGAETDKYLYQVILVAVVELTCHNDVYLLGRRDLAVHFGPFFILLKILIHKWKSTNWYLLKNVIKKKKKKAIIHGCVS